MYIMETRVYNNEEGYILFIYFNNGLVFYYDNFE
jgi:hypothetical protein